MQGVQAPGDRNRTGQQLGGCAAVGAVVGGGRGPDPLCLGEEKETLGMTLLGRRPPPPGCQASAHGQWAMLLPCLSTRSRAPLNTPSGPAGPGCGCASVGLTLQVTRPSLEMPVISRALSGPTIRAPPQRGRAKAAIAQGGPWEGRWLLGWGHRPRLHPRPAQARPLEHECAKHGQLRPPRPARYSLS